MRRPLDKLSYVVQTPHAKKTRPCDFCRRQKRKCDKITPACSSCIKKNEVCVYDPTLDQRSPEKRDYVAALEARIALLEGILRDAGTRDVAGPSGFASTDREGPVHTMCAIAPPPIMFTQPRPSLGSKPGPESEPGFVPSDDAAQALVSIAHPSPEELNTAASEELDLGMGGYVPLVSLDMELKLLAVFWDWQRLHCPYVAPAPFLSAYALYAQVAHPGEPIPPSSPPPPPANPLAGSRAMSVPSPESVHADPELAQFISPLLLDAMFVIGALFHGDAELSNQFYKRAEARVIGEAAKPRLATVQGVMMMAKAELGHARAPAAWTLNGMTVALCVRLGMHVNATPLVRCGTMSKTLFETRNFVFWTIYNNDRFYGICLGINPLMDRRIISTPRHSSLAAANVVKPDATVARPSSGSAEKPTASGVGTTWWSPATLGMGDMVVQAGWEATRDLVRITDMLIDGIYSFDAPKRTPQEDLELVARNNLTIQRFLDELPAWLRSTDGIRIKYNGIVYLHLFTHLVSILACRPFLSPRPLSEDAMRLDAATDISQPTHSSHIIRRYRALAFHVARASALQITSLVRHIPLSCPCVSNSYLIYTACTILLLVPDDTAAMSGVRTGLACLESMCEAGYWLNSMKDGKERILALAKRWGVDIGQGKKVHEPVLGGRGEGSGTGGPTKDEDAGTESNDAGSSGTNSSAHEHLGSSSETRTALESETGIGGCATRPSASTVVYGEGAESSATYIHALSSWTQQYGDISLDQMYADQAYPDDIAPAANYACAAPLSQESDIAAASDARYTTVTHNYDTWEWTRVSCSYASGMVYADRPENGPTHAPQQQSPLPTPVRFSTQTYTVQYHYSSQTHLSVIDYERQVRHSEGLASAPQEQVYPQQSHYQQQYHQPLIQQQPQTRYQPQPQSQAQYQPHQYQAPLTQYHHAPAPPASLLHATYTPSHANALHESQLLHTRQHQFLPSADPNFPFASDPVAYTDPAECFADTAQMTQEPAFLRTMEDPYAGVADVICSFPATMDAYAGLGAAGSSTGMGAAAGTPLDGGAPGIYAQSTESGSYR